MNEEIIFLFREWIKKLGVNYGIEKVPCVPIAKIGPSLIFGHYTKEGINLSDWPQDLFQHVFIPERQYWEIANQLKGVFLETKKEVLNSALEFREVKSKDDYLDLILSDLIIEDSIKPFLLSFKGRSNWDLMDLPSGCREYYSYLRFGIPIVPLHLAEISIVCFEMIPKFLQERYEALCFAKEGTTLYVATTKTHSTELEDLIIAKFSGAITEVVLCLSSESLIREKRQDCLKQKKKEGTALMTEGQIAQLQTEAKGNLELNTKLVESVDIKKGEYSPETIFQWILYEAIHRDATDIHIEMSNNRGRVRFRMDGDLFIFYEPSEVVARALVTVCKNICSMSSNLYDNQDAAFSVKYDGQKINLRVNAIPFRKDFQKIALRILPRKNSLTTLDNLGLANDHLGLLRRAITRKQGLILITGPTGEGKTTTLYAALTEINKPNINIQTIEDPIEREIEGINQTAVNLAQEVTFSKIMRSVVRQDPNVILLGEIRDQESAKLAIEAALTGHLVFSTLHANSAIKAIQRLVQLEVPHYSNSASARDIKEGA